MCERIIKFCDFWRLFSRWNSHFGLWEFFNAQYCGYIRGRWEYFLWYIWRVEHVMQRELHCILCEQFHTAMRFTLRALHFSFDRRVVHAWNYSRKYFEKKHLKPQSSSALALIFLVNKISRWKFSNPKVLTWKEIKECESDKRDGEFKFLFTKLKET